MYPTSGYMSISIYMYVYVILYDVVSFDIVSNSQHTTREIHFFSFMLNRFSVTFFSYRITAFWGRNSEPKQIPRLLFIHNIKFCAVYFPKRKLICSISTPCTTIQVLFTGLYGNSL